MHTPPNLSLLGFNQNKQQVYLSALTLGNATASEIAKHSGVERTTVYKIMLELVKERLTEEKIGKVKQFAILNPVALVKKQEENKRIAEALLPNLLQIFNEPIFKPKLHFYEGEAGVKKVFEDPLNQKAGGFVYSFSSVHNIADRFGMLYTRHYTEKRVRAGIKRFSLRPVEDKPRDKKNWEVFASEDAVRREIRYLPAHIKCDSLIQIYDGKIGVIASKKEGYAFILESKDLFQLMNQVFEWLWKISDAK